MDSNKTNFTTLFLLIANLVVTILSHNTEIIGLVSKVVHWLVQIMKGAYMMNIISNLLGCIVLLSIIITTDYIMRRLLYRPNVKSVQRVMTIIFDIIAGLIGVTRVILAFNTKQSIVCIIFIIILTIVTIGFILGNCETR